MPRRNKSWRTVVAFFYAAIVLSLGFFNSCATTPKMKSVDPVELLDTDATVYISIPAAEHKDFLKQVLCAKVAGLSEKNANKIVNRVSWVYFAVHSSGKKVDSYQIIVTGSFPQLSVNKLLTNNNGWVRYVLQQKNRTYTYFKQKNSSLELSLFSSNLLVLTDNINSMINRYDSQIAAAFPLLEYQRSDNVPIGWDKETYQWIKNTSSNNIRLYSSAPDCLIAVFFGKKISFGIQTVEGTLSENQKKNLFNLEVSMKLDSRTIKAGLSLLKIALFPIPAKIVQSDSNHISITDVTLSWKELESLFSR